MDQPVFSRALVGDVDMARESEFAEIVDSFSASPSAVAEIDLRQVTFFDSSGLRFLVELRDIAVGRGGGVVLVGARAPVERLLAVTDLSGLFELRAGPAAD